ncbi:MAG: hypothetical protein RI911_674 [Candidatus Parcubacteria bacterium]|jgi:NRAMP (natural resistance-associated macrophage protein)-like metal ion transporter
MLSKIKKRIQKYSAVLGPGLTTGAADDDPSGIATYSQAGAQYGYSVLWLALFSFPLMAIVQTMCARIGIVTGKGLAANIRMRYGTEALMFVCVLLFFANTLNIAADLAAMAAAIELLLPQLNTMLLIALIGFSIVWLEIYLPYNQYASVLKYLTLALFSYVIAVLAIDVDWGKVVTHTLIPTIEFTPQFFILLCAILGTTISPYLFFWQTSQEVEDRAHRKSNAPNTSDASLIRAALKRMHVDVWSGMAFSNIVMFCIMLTCAATLHEHGITTITSAESAANALRPVAGTMTYIFFTVGIIGTGLLAIPILAGSSAYALAEAFEWTHGLNKQLHEAYAFYGVITLSVFLGIFLNWFEFDPMQLLLYASVLNGLIAPVILCCIVAIAGSLKIQRTKGATLYAGYALVFLLAFVAVAALYAIAQ